jgi:hypothetical protein
MSVMQPSEYMTQPLELWSVVDLTDALGIAKAAETLGTSSRVVYTVRNTGALSVDRVKKLINAVREDEPEYRQKLVIARNLQKQRAERVRPNERTQ